MAKESLDTKSKRNMHGKIVEKINSLPSGKKFFSLEFFPPKTEAGMANVMARLERMAKLNPLFVTVTWGAGGTSESQSIELASVCQNEFGLETCLHLTCTNMKKDILDNALDKAKQEGIRNILALRGDPPRGEEYFEDSTADFVHAVDLVRYIRSRYGNYFCIGVAAYPEGHTDSSVGIGPRSFALDLPYLVQKIEAGADFIISQLFYDCKIFLEFEKQLREYDNGRLKDILLIPSVMPIQTFQSFKRLTRLAQISVPQELMSHLERITKNDEEVKAKGIQIAVDTVNQIFIGTEGRCYGVHFCTLNLEKSVVAVLNSSILKEKRLITEDVTLTWDEYPNGRFTDARSPAFGETDAYGNMSHVAPEDVDLLWGRPKSLKDIQNLFIAYCCGKISKMPWFDGPLAAEAESIAPYLIKMNQLGFYTISSQPAVNDIPSSDSVYGWGPPNGFVYQKAFLEFFVSESVKNKLIELMPAYPDLTYYVTNETNGAETNMTTPGPNAVTWGVYPGKEIIQPTIIDVDSFMAWRSEAYVLGREWAKSYPVGSDSRNIINMFMDTHYLMNIVHNDYKKPLEIFDIFEKAIGSSSNN